MIDIPAVLNLSTAIATILLLWHNTLPYEFTLSLIKDAVFHNILQAVNIHFRLRVGMSTDMPCVSYFLKNVMVRSLCDIFLFILMIK